MTTGIPNAIDGKLVTFLATDGLVLHGFLVEGRVKKGCIVYVHGMSSNFYKSTLSKRLAAMAPRYGYSTFMINTRGHDILSNGNVLSGRRHRRVLNGTAVESFEESSNDIEGALRFLKSIGYRRFVLAGHSTGCQKILYYQYKRKASKVCALVLLAPDDDYNLNRKELGRRWNGLVGRARTLVRARKGKTYDESLPFAPARFLSIADPGRVEARLFNYDGALREFASVTAPIYVAFGTKDEGAVKPASEYIRILRERTGSRKFGSLLISGARHSFRGHEDELSRETMKWLSEA